MVAAGRLVVVDELRGRGEGVGPGRTQVLGQLALFLANVSGVDLGTEKDSDAGSDGD